MPSALPAVRLACQTGELCANPPGQSGARGGAKAGNDRAKQEAVGKASGQRPIIGSSLVDPGMNEPRDLQREGKCHQTDLASCLLDKRQVFARTVGAAQTACCNSVITVKKVRHVLSEFSEIRFECLIFVCMFGLLSRASWFLVQGVGF